VTLLYDGGGGFDGAVLVADGDLTADPTVPRPEEVCDEAAEVYDEPTGLNAHLEAAVETIHDVVETPTGRADTLNHLGASLSATTEEAHLRRHPRFTAGGRRLPSTPTQRDAQG